MHKYSESQSIWLTEKIKFTHTHIYIYTYIFFFEQDHGGMGSGAIFMLASTFWKVFQCLSNQDVLCIYRYNFITLYYSKHYYSLGQFDY